MRNLFLLITCFVFSLRLFASDQSFVYNNNFNDPGNIPALGKGISYQKTGGIDNSGCMKYTCKAQSDSAMSVISLDANEVKGRKIVIRAQIKAENVGTPAKSYLGPKLMISYTCTNGNKSWPGVMIDRGTYEYKEFSRMVRVPNSVNDIKLNIGLQQCAGTLYFDNVSVELIPQSKAAADFVKPEAPLQKTPKFRGVMISPRGMKANNWKDMDDLSQWSANLIRYQMSPENKNLPATEYVNWIKSEIPHIDECLKKCKKYGMKMVIDLHKGPGTKKSKYSSNILCWTKENQQVLIEVWKVLAKYYKGNDLIYAYEILNEPREAGTAYNPNEMDWYELVPIVAQEIRKIDSKTPIIISPLEWSNPNGFNSLKPYNIPGLIYTVHMYVPHQITHQGVRKSKVGFSYPGKAGGKFWNKEQLRKALKPVVDFQKKYNVPIFVGEFSCIRWAPGDSANNYLKDSIELFEENGWDWTYHAFREWDGWSVEHGNDPKDRAVKKTTPRKELLLEYMKKNKPVTAK